MASYDVLKELVTNGSSLVLTRSISYDVLKELAAIASRSGAKITVTTAISYEVLRELSSKYKGTITFIDGLDEFKKD